MFKRKSNNRKESLRYPDAKEVRVSVIFTRLGEIDTINERFSCEATLLISWNEGIDMLKQVEDGDDDTYYWDSQSFWDPQLYIDNAIGEVKEKDVKFRLEKHWDDEKRDYYFEVHMIKKIQGVFFEKLELYNFPFDVQDLSLTLTSHRTSNEVFITQDLNILAKMTKSASLDKHIWKLYDHVNFKIHTIRNDIPQASDFYSDSYDAICSNSAITMQCRVSRKPGYFVINCLMPTFMITLCVFFTFMMDHKRYQYRFALLFTTMLTSITFRWAIHGRVLPTISYLTFLDVYCVSSILTVFSAMIWHSIWLVIYKENPVLADKCDGYAMFTFAIIVFLEHCGQGVWFMIALQKKLELDRLDKLAASKYVEHRKSLHSNQIQKNMVAEQSDQINTLKPKRLMYSFNKLNDSSVITIVHGPVHKEEVESLSTPVLLEGSSISSNGILKNKTVIFTQSHNNERLSFKNKKTYSQKLRTASTDVSPGSSLNHLSTSKVSSSKSISNNMA